MHKIKKDREKVVLVSEVKCAGRTAKAGGGFEIQNNLHELWLPPHVSTASWTSWSRATSCRQHFTPPTATLRRRTFWPPRSSPTSTPAALPQFTCCRSCYVLAPRMPTASSTACWLIGTVPCSCSTTTCSRARAWMRCSRHCAARWWTTAGRASLVWPRVLRSPRHWSISCVTILRWSPTWASSAKKTTRGPSTHAPIASASRKSWSARARVSSYAFIPLSLKITFLPSFSLQPSQFADRPPGHDMPSEPLEG
ncbi:hypothetical protein BC828DRAFT_170132 [Blastocladiella britannica]|nr:hypothetical protein BC828DRAFT_170132 [Blastocladiella britannica]